MKTLYEQIEEVVKTAGETKDFYKVKETVTFRNIKNPKLVVNSLEEAVEKGLNLAEYHKVVETFSPKKDTLKAIFGEDAPLSKEKVQVLNKFSAVLQRLQVKDISKEEKAIKSAYAIYVNVRAGRNKSVTEDKALENLNAAYRAAGKKEYTPRGRDLK